MPIKEVMNTTTKSVGTYLPYTVKVNGHRGEGKHYLSETSDGSYQAPCLQQADALYAGPKAQRKMHLIERLYKQTKYLNHKNLIH